MIDLQLLIQSPVFNGLDVIAVEDILNRIHFQIKHYNRNDIIALSGDRVKNLYILLEGSVKGEMIDYGGKVVKIEDVEAPKPIAPAFLFGNENNFPVTVTASNEVKLLTIPVADFLKILQSNDQVLLNYLNGISSRSQFLTKKLQFLSFKSIKEKMAHYLLHNTDGDANRVILKITQQQMAELFGVARPSVARVINEMQKDNLIKVERKIVNILDKEGLLKIIRNG